MSGVEPTLALIQQQQGIILTELGTMRDDMRVLMAIVQRMDGTVSGLVGEIRATHAQMARFERRLRTVEGAP